MYVQVYYYCVPSSLLLMRTFKLGNVYLQVYYCARSSVLLLIVSTVKYTSIDNVYLEVYHYHHVYLHVYYYCVPSSFPLHGYLECTPHARRLESSHDTRSTATPADCGTFHCAGRPTPPSAKAIFWRLLLA